MNNLWIDETWCDRTQNCIVGNSEAYETSFEDRGKLFRFLRREYGRPSKQYVDKAGKTIQTGWVFTKRVKYEDCNETYLQETWVTVFKSKPVKHVTWDVEYAFGGSK